MRLIGLNVQHGGGRRHQRIVEAVDHLGPDIAVLSEFHGTPRGLALLRKLADVGLPHHAWSVPANAAYPNAVAIASRKPIDATRQPISSELNGHRVLEARIGALDVVGVYFPLAKPKVAFWHEEFLPFARTNLLGQRVILGDWNSGLHHIDEAGAVLHAADAFEEMSTMGWVDAWRRLHPDDREYTWYSRPWNNGFRLDHAFLSPALLPALRGATYDHGIREAKVSDHSALIVDLDE